MKPFGKIVFAIFLVIISSCTKDEPISEGASKAELQVIVNEIENHLKEDIDLYYNVLSILGREYYYFSNSESRYTGELLGKGDEQLDNSAFYISRPYSARYSTVRKANLLITEATNSKQLTAQETSGYIGVAKTFQAYELLLVANMLYKNGININVQDQDNLDEIVTYDNALIFIEDLLVDAIIELERAGETFSFSLSNSMERFNTPNTFSQFSNAVAARALLYQGIFPSALEYLSLSFMDIDGDLNIGPARSFSNVGSGDTNQLYITPDQNEALIAHPNFLSQSDPRDQRRSKVKERQSGSLTIDGLTGDYDVSIYKSSTDVIPFIRNEELILIYAEANMRINPNESLRALNTIRTAAGLDNFKGSGVSALVPEILYQRAYSLFGEGHRWIDMRRWDLLEQLPLDRQGDDVWSQFPRPDL